MSGLMYLYNLLSLGLSYPEGKNWVVIERLLSIADSLCNGELLDQIKSFGKCFAERKQRINDMESEYLRIFDIGGKISPYETEYLTEKISRKPFELADIAGFYNAFGFGINEDTDNKESVDHISVELEFMAILAWKEEYARENQQEEHLTIVQDARMKFLKEHLATWGFFFRRRIREFECDDFYKGLGGILESLLNLECERHGLNARLFRKEISREPYNGIRDQELTCGQMFSAADD